VAWQAGNAVGMFLLGSTIQSMIVIMYTDYTAEAWQSFLLALAAIVITYIGNVYGARILPYWQNALFVVHIMAFFALIVPIWINAPKATHEQVWADFAAFGGWPNMGLTIMVGQLTGISNQIGVDAVC
jgi:choline transport protein